MVAAALTLDEAVPLGYALVSRAAELNGIRALAIKGPVLAAQGLRSESTSVDVDVLVEPARFDRFREALEELGWTGAARYDLPRIVPSHSVTHRHPGWVCEIDVHHWFPGFLADPADVFDAFWERRTTLEIAHHEIPVPDQVAHAGLMALHYLRDQGFDWAHGKLDALSVRLQSTWDHAMVVDLSAFAADTGASDTLRPFLDLVGAPRVPSSRANVVPLDDWTMRSRAETREVLPWIVGLRRTPWRQRPAFVWRALWLSDQQFQSRDVTLPDSRRALAVARWQRLRRGVRALPAALRDYRRLTSDD